MARTIDEIYNSILAAKAARPELDGLNSTSRTAIYTNLFWVMAAVIWTVEKLWDLFRSDIETILENKIPGRLPWYRDLALQFRYGQDLDANGHYDDTGLTDAAIEAMKIIKYASVTEIGGKLRMKVAKQASSLPVQLNSFELAAFSDYIQKLKYAGVNVIKDSLPPDDLSLVLDIFYNPLVLKSDGSRLDGSAATPVKDGIKAYLNQLPFNGEYSNTRLVDELQKVSGVVLPVIKVSQQKFGLFPFSVIDEKYIPDAGYLSLADADLTINYREYV